MSKDSRDTDTGRTGDGQHAGNDVDRICYYRIRFRKIGREFTASSTLPDLAPGTCVILGTDHGAEPAMIVGRAAGHCDEGGRGVSYPVERVCSEEEERKYARLPLLEREGFDFCLQQIKRLNLPMHLVRVERYFNGSKIIFYFTADSRVDFRELVKSLVQEFRTRVEMRQIGVRHETQMTGGIGACGRELCCTSFLKQFDSVSIKMAKTQDLPLNPAKISGVCNRLLCCLTYEYENYHTMKKGMPRVGRSIRFEDKVYRVIRQMALRGTVLTVGEDGEERVLTEDEWRKAQPVHKPRPRQKGKKGQRRPRKSGKRQAKKQSRSADRTKKEKP